MKRKGFTLVELLVVIAIIALLMGILMPALARVRQLAFRMTCGTNLSGIGKAMLIYSNDYEEELPRAGGRSSNWGGPVAWGALDRFGAYRLAADGSGGSATISSSFYLLVKYSEVTPKSFICKGDSGTTEWKLSDEAALPRADFENIDAWDFGSEADKHSSYSYHIPFGIYALTVTSEPGFAVAADKNPWIESRAATARTPFSVFGPDIAPYNASTDKARQGNCNAHQLDGQNVMFLDTHVLFEKRAYCSSEDDNIYTFVQTGTTTGHPIGEPPVPVSVIPGNRKDAVLVHDPPNIGSGGGGGTTPPPRR